jgi:hypothetical protein
VEKIINTDRYIPMPTKLQTALCTMTVSMEAPHSGQAGFKFQKPSCVSGTTCSWEDNIKMDVKEIVIEGVNWMEPFQDKVQQRACEHCNELS